MQQTRAFLRCSLQCRGFNEEQFEWLLRSHHGLWPEPTWKRPALTARPNLPFPHREDRSLVLDFCECVPDWLGGILVAGQASFPVGKQSSFPFQNADAPGFEHFFAHTFVNFMAATSRSSRNVIATPAFPASFFLTTYSSTGQKAVSGTDCAANILSPKRRFIGRRLFCSCETRAIVSFLSMYR